MTLQKNFCNYISTIRNISKLSITAFSEELQISRSMLQDILNGKANPRMDTVEHIAGRLQVDPIQLLKAPYSKEQLHVAMPLISLTNSVTGFSQEKMQRLLELINEILWLCEDCEK